MDIVIEMASDMAIVPRSSGLTFVSSVERNLNVHHHKWHLPHRSERSRGGGVEGLHTLIFLVVVEVRRSGGEMLTSPRHA